jgi:hypothetical protein
VRELLAQRDYRVRGIIRLYAIASLNAAARAAMYEHVVRASTFHFHRFHETATCGGSISRRDVHMLAPQAQRAVIGKSVANDELAAMLTSEIFDYFLKHGYCTRTDAVRVTD